MENGVIGFLAATLLAWLLYFFLIRPKYERKLKTLFEELSNKQRESLSKSRSTIKGHLAEQLYPLLPNCPYITSDMRFMGMPIDYIIFKGYTEAKDNGGEIEEIIFADVKQGSSRLSSHQNKIKAAIEAGRVRWETIQISSQFEVQ
jgi:predicted Holliday junction resolvase-like endonuclease